MTGEIDYSMIFLRQINRAEDLSTISEWLHKDYIKNWYGDPEEWLSEIRNNSGKFDWIHHYMVVYQDMPIGFCQYYDCSKTSEGCEWDAEPLGTFGIDYMIGEEIFLKKGVSNVIIQQLCRLICTLETPVQIIADPDPENIASIRSLEKNGFALDPTTGLYKMKIK